MPDMLDPKRPVQVVLHFDGWGLSSGPGRQGSLRRLPRRLRETASKRGTVRDVDQEHWAQQMSAVVGARTAQQPQIVAVLVPGRGKSEFGDFPTYGHVDEVFGKVTAFDAEAIERTMSWATNKSKPSTRSWPPTRSTPRYYGIPDGWAPR